MPDRSHAMLRQQRGDARPRHAPDDEFGATGHDPWLSGDNASRYGGTALCHGPSATSTNPAGAPLSAAEPTTKRQTIAAIADARRRGFAG